MSTAKSKSLVASLLMLLAAFIWGTAFVAQRKGLESVSNFTFLTLRSYLAVAALLPVALVTYHRGRRAEAARGVYHSFFSKKLVICGAICGVILFVASLLQQIGISHSGVGKSGFLTALYILMVPLLGLLLKHRVKPVLWVCICIALVGMYFLCVTSVGGIGFGDWMLIGCAFGYSVHITLIDRFVGIVDGIRLSLMQLLFCGLLSTVFMLIFEHVPLQVILSAWFAIAYAGVMSSGAAFTLQIISQKNLDPTVASLIMSLESVFAALGGAVFGERLSVREIFGCCLMFAAILLSQLPFDRLLKKKKPAAEADGLQEEK